MANIDNKQLIAQLNWRYATKQFDPQRKISAHDWEALEETLVLAPSGGGLQPWTFLVIDDPATRLELQKVSYGQPQIVDASHLVVFAAQPNYGEVHLNAHITRVAQVRGINVEDLAPLRAMAMNAVIKGKNDVDRRAWAVNQTYIALGSLLTGAALLGIDACPMEGFERAGYDRILGLETMGLASTVIATLGHRAATDKYAGIPKVRFPRKEVVLHV
jgi:nitroreductase